MTQDIPLRVDTSDIEPAASTVRAGLERYLRVNGFSIDTYNAPTFSVDVFGRKLVMFNTPGRKRAIPLHDLHHVATGYGTDLVGEAEIGVWELVAGCDSLVLYWLNGSAALLGALLAPRRMIQAALDARGQRTLYVAPLDYEKALSMSVGEFRAHLGVPEGGQAREPARLNDSAPVTA